MRIVDVMTTSLITVEPSTRVRDAELAAKAKGVRHLLVVGDGPESLLGVLCMCDLAGADETMPVSAHMTRDIRTTHLGQEAGEAAELMIRERIGCLPVIAGGRLVGIVTRSDLHRAGLEATPEPEEPVVCASCHATVEVHGRGTPGVSWCLECMVRARDSEDDEDIGGG